MTARRTSDERDVIDASIELRSGSTSRATRLSLVDDLLERGLLTPQVLRDLAFGENMAGYVEGTREAMGDLE